MGNNSCYFLKKIKKKKIKAKKKKAGEQKKREG